MAPYHHHHDAAGEYRYQAHGNRSVKQSRRGNLEITHHFALNDITPAYDTFENAARQKALSVILTSEQ